MSVTCHTEGCPVSGITFAAVPMTPNAEPPIFRAVCGQCGGDVTDLVPMTTG
jgi:hypothetical protein